MTIAIGNDHAGTDYKFKIIEFLEKEGYKVLNFGTDLHESIDYPDYIHKVAASVENKVAEKGIILCGSGNGAAITANHHKEIRAALCWNEKTATLARQHNDANILSIPARFISIEEALKFVKIFLNTSFEGGRHLRRIKKIPFDNC